ATTPTQPYFSDPVSEAFLMANTALVSKITPVKNVDIRGWFVGGAGQSTPVHMTLCSYSRVEIHSRNFSVKNSYGVEDAFGYSNLLTGTVENCGNLNNASSYSSSAVLVYSSTRNTTVDMVMTNCLGFGLNVMYSNHGSVHN